MSRWQKTQSATDRACELGHASPEFPRPPNSPRIPLAASVVSWPKDTDYQEHNRGSHRTTDAKTRKSELEKEDSFLTAHSGGARLYRHQRMLQLFPVRPCGQGNLASPRKNQCVQHRPSV